MVPKLGTGLAYVSYFCANSDGSVRIFVYRCYWQSDGSRVGYTLTFGSLRDWELGFGLGRGVPKLISPGWQQEVESCAGG